MTVFNIIILVCTIVICPVYFWFMKRAKNTWVTSSHETYGGSLTIIDKEHQVVFKDPMVKKKKGEMNE